MDGGGEVCLAEEAERLRRSGLSVDEVARRMGVDPSWVETVVLEDGEDRDRASERPERPV
jgi:hypothetical protein